MDGFLNIYKEPGWTSFDVVAKLRGILKQKKIGHTGTLDPAAEGVLPVAVGRATKLCDLVGDGTKTYETVLLLGVRTDTLDMEGQVIETCPVSCSPEEVERCVASFLGEQEQTPPMYSALKINGRRLYELARAGESVERKKRKVTFYALTVLETDLPRVKIRITCSKGTYIRSLCDDIGAKLGCGGCMEKLVRTGSGGFDRREARTIAQVGALMKEGRIGEALIPMDAVFADYPQVVTAQSADKAAHNGNKIGLNGCTASADACRTGQNVRLYDSGHRFIGIYIFTGQVFQPVKVLFQEQT